MLSNMDTPKLREAKRIFNTFHSNYNEGTLIINGVKNDH
jgi:hypothetical protein